MSKNIKFKKGDPITLDTNKKGCGENCTCIWTKEKHPYLKENINYIIEDITELQQEDYKFQSLHLKGIPETYKRNTKLYGGIHGNYFKLVEINNLNNKQHAQDGNYRERDFDAHED